MSDWIDKRIVLFDIAGIFVLFEGYKVTGRYLVAVEINKCKRITGVTRSTCRRWYGNER